MTQEIYNKQATLSCKAEVSPLKHISCTLFKTRACGEKAVDRERTGKISPIEKRFNLVYTGGHTDG